MSLSQLFNKMASGTLSGIVIPLIAGLMIAACIAYLLKRIYGKFVTALLRGESVDEESARSLSELGMDKKRLLRRTLRDGSSLRKVVMKTESADGTVRYYIPEDKRDRASSLYASDRSTVLTVIVAFILFAVIAILLLMYLPKLIEFASDLF